MLKKENKVKKFMKNKIINIKGKINKVLRKNIKIIHVLSTLINLVGLIISISLYDINADVSFLALHQKKEREDNLLLSSILLLSFLNRLFFLFNEEIQKITLYSDIAVSVLFLFEILALESDPFFFIFFRRVLYLFPFCYSIYTKFLKK